MSTPSDQTLLCLLDKNVILRTIQGLRGLDELPEEQAVALALWRRAEQQSIRLFIPMASFNILRRLSSYHEVRLFVASVEVLRPGRYFRRWARRLRGMHFTREDANVLSLGSFGVDEEGLSLGVHVIATYDQALINKYTLDYEAVQGKLEAMTDNLAPPFRRASLPEVRRPEELL